MSISSKDILRKFNRLSCSLLIVSVFSFSLVAQENTKIFSFGFSYNLNRGYNEWIEVSAVYPNSPASRMNVKEGDYITAIDQKPTSTLSNEAVAKMFTEAKKARIIKLKINDEKEIALNPDTVALYQCIYGDCNNGYGRRQDYQNNREYAGMFTNGKYNGEGIIKAINGDYLTNKFKGLEAFKVEEIEGTFQGTELLALKNIRLSGRCSYKGQLGKYGPNGRGSFTITNIKYEGNFNEEGNMDGEFTITFPNKQVQKNTFKNTRVSPLYGYANEFGKTVVAAKYVNVYPYNEGYALAENMANEIVVLDKKANEVGKMPNYTEMGTFKEGLCAVRMYKKWGFINTSGKLVTPMIYERPVTENYKIEKRENFPYPEFKNGIAVVCKNGLFGTISKTGKTIIPFMYDGIQLYNGNYTVVTKDNLQGVVDKTGKIIVPIKYQQVWVEDGGNFFRVKKFTGSNTFSLFNTNGEEIPGTNEEHVIGKFENGFAFYKDIYLYRGIINSKGEKIQLLGGYDIDPLKNVFVNGMAVVKMKDKNGVIDTKGNILLPFKYYYLTLYDGIATTTENKDDINSTILDVKGNIIFQTNNTRRITMGVGRNMYYKGYVVASDDDGNLSILDKTGKLLYTAPKGAIITYVNQQDVFMLNDNTGTYRFIQPNGKELCRFTHTMLSYPGFTDGMAPVSGK